MKKIITLGIIAFLLILNSCTKPEIKNETVQPTSEITGLWSLTKVTGGFAGVNQSFVGTILYDFDTLNNKLNVTNNYVGTSIANGLPTGNYPFLLAGTNDININSQKAKYTITENKLYIDENVAADGFGFTFERFLFCGTPDTCIAFNPAFVISATVPSTGIVNNVVQIPIKFSINNGCGGFGNITEINISNTKTLTVNAKYTGCVCTQLMGEVQTIYNFTPTTTGLQIIKIAQPDGTFLIYNINITN
jgi:hypothetical protein